MLLPRGQVLLSLPHRLPILLRHSIPESLKSKSETKVPVGYAIDLEFLGVDVKTRPTNIGATKLSFPVWIYSEAT